MMKRIFWIFYASAIVMACLAGLAGAADKVAETNVNLAVSDPLNAPEFGPDTVYVSIGGTDRSGASSRIAPYRTIQWGVNYSQQDNVVLVLPGTYNESIYMPWWNVLLLAEQGPDVTIIDGSNKGAPIIFQSAGAAKPGETQQETRSVVDGFTITCPSCEGLANDGAVSIAYEDPIIRNNIIINNRLSPTGETTGGGIYVQSGDPLIYNNVIVHNTASAGAGIYVGWFAQPLIINNTIIDNTNGFSGGGAGIELDYDAGDAVIRNNIIAYNSGGDGLSNGSISNNPILSNTLFWGNQGGSYSGTFTDRTGIINDIPYLVDFSNGDYRLECVSPAINKGLALAIDTLTTRDLDGNPRHAYSLPDLGALEFIDDNKQADFSATVLTGCRPLSVDFTNLSSCIDEQWLWDFGDGEFSSEKNPTHQYLTSGVYSVTLIADGDFDSDTLVREDYVSVFGNLQVDFNADTTFGCVPFAVTFTPTVSGTADEYLWDFGDGNQSQDMAPTHTYTTAGHHTVQLTVTNICGPTTTIKSEYIQAERVPVLSIVSSADADSLGGEPACTPFQVRFYAVAEESLTSFRWDFGDNNQSTERNPVHTYEYGDTFSVQLIATGLCGTGEVVNQDYIGVRQRPSAVPAADLTDGCLPLQIAFSATSTGEISEYLWRFGDGDSASGRNVSHTYTAVGEYEPELEITHECGVDVMPLPETIVARDVPIADYDCPSSVGFAPFTYEFVDRSVNEPSSWLWEFGDGETSTETSPVHTYRFAGEYDVNLSVSSGCGEGIAVKRSGCVVVGGFDARVGEPFQTGKTTIYPLTVDTLQGLPYPNPIIFSVKVEPTPYRGELKTELIEPLAALAAVPHQLWLTPSDDLPSGQYTVSLFAVDSTLGFADTNLIVFEHEGTSILALNPFTIDFDSVDTRFSASLPARVVNTASTESGFTLTIDSLRVVGEGFSITPVTDVIVDPSTAYTFPVNFGPPDRLTYDGSVRVFTNDPVVRDTMILLTGRGIPEQDAPVVVSTDPANLENDVLINAPLQFEFSEPIRVDDTDTSVVVRSARTGANLAGSCQTVGKLATFSGNEFWPAFDTLFVRIQSRYVTDTVYNHLDGDADGLEEGSPVDDYDFKFVTGPGVFPGDADDNGEVDERDVLPLGRFWSTTGPPRPLAYESFSAQPANLWPDSAATYADTDGDGDIDSLDICPILEFWSAVRTAPLAREQAFFDELSSLSGDIIGSMLAAIDFCPNRQSASELREILGSWVGLADNGPPRQFELMQNYPNPFNARTVITFILPAPAEVELVIFNTRGEKVATPVAEYRTAGRHVIVWDGLTADGRTVASGMYFYRLRAGENLQTRKMILLK